MSWTDGKYCLSRRVVGGRFVLKIERREAKLFDAFVDAIRVGSSDTPEGAQWIAEHALKGFLKKALGELLEPA